MSPPSFTRFAGFLRTRPLMADLLLAGCLLMFATLGRVAFPPEYVSIRQPLWWLCWTLLVLIPVVLRRRWTMVALVMVFVLCLTAAATGWNSIETTSLLVVTYTVAAYWPSGRAVLSTLLVWVPVVGLGLVTLNSPTHPTPELVTSPLTFVATNVMLATITLFAGRYRYTRWAYEADLRERTRVAEATQQALADQAVADERRRIARELHDVVAHHVSVMGVMAAGARRSMRTDPAAVDAALGTIEETGRTTLRELRRLLNVLRTDDERADLTPQPGLAGVAALIEQLREAGLSVRLDVNGASHDLDPGIDLTVYRIVQEALTNTLKHAGRASALVRLSFAEDHLEVEVADDGRGPAVTPNKTGHGLVGIRERVALYGGRLWLGARPGGGFRVVASIPVERVDTVNGRAESDDLSEKTDR